MSKWTKILQKISENSSRKFQDSEPLTVDTFLKNTDPANHVLQTKDLSVQKEGLMINKIMLGMIILLVGVNAFVPVVGFLTFRELSEHKAVMHQMSIALGEQKQSMEYLQDMLGALENKQTQMMVLEGRIENLDRTLQDAKTNFRDMNQQINVYESQQQKLDVTVQQLINQNDVLEKTVQELKQNQTLAPVQILPVPILQTQ
jgi:septal ring factor EnvC (AmiA/AmiB activator)